MSELALDRSVGRATVAGLAARDGAGFELLRVDNCGTFVGLLHSAPPEWSVNKPGRKNCRYTVQTQPFQLLFLPNQSPIWSNS